MPSNKQTNVHLNWTSYSKHY